MPRLPLAALLCLAFAAPAAAAVPDTSPIDRQLRAMLAQAPADPEAPTVLRTQRIDPRVAFAWSTLPALGLLAVGFGIQAADRAYWQAGLDEQAARGVQPIDYEYRNLFFAPVGMVLPVLTPLSFGGGHYYVGEPTRGTLVTLGGPLATLAGFALGMVATSVAPQPTPAAGSGPPVNYALSNAVTAGILGCAAYGVWAGWDASRLAGEKNRAAGYAD